MDRRVYAVAGLMVIALMTLVLAMPVSATGEGNTLRVGPGQAYSTIQAAVDAAKQGSRILVYPHTYVEAVSVTKNNLQIMAQGDGVIVAPPLGQPAGFEVTADHVTIRGFEIGAGGEYGDDDCTAGIAFEGSHNTFTDNYVYQIRSCLMGVDAIDCLDEDGGSDFNTIEDNAIHATDRGIVMGAVTEEAINRGNVIRSNTFHQLTMAAIAIWNGREFLVAGNHIDMASGACIGVSTSDENKIAQGHHRIEGNTMDACPWNGIAVEAYEGGVLTHNRIAENTIQSCGWECISLEAHEGAVLTYNRIAGNTVETCGWGGFGLGSDCISLEAREGAVLTHNIVSDNEASFSKVCGIGLGAAWDATGATVGNNLVRGNLVHHNLSGICLNPKADNNRVDKNEAQDNTADGIVVFGDGNRITSNSVHDNVDSGIEVLGGSNAILKNTALHNGEFDLADWGADNRWRNNEYETANW